MKILKVASVVGARPQFVKLAPLGKKLSSVSGFEHVVVHTGQHYDYLMSKVFFDELGIPEPNYNLEIGSGHHGWQTGEMLKKIEEMFFKEKPDWILVYGDTNSTLAGALAGVKLHLSVAHIEAGLRSYNRRMPEEINRVLTDHCSSLLLCPTEKAVENLKKEGFSNLLLSNDDGWIVDRFEFPAVAQVGDLMLEALGDNLQIAERKSKILETLHFEPGGYYLATVHRAENTDNLSRLRDIIEALDELSSFRPVIFPVHPRTKKLLREIGKGLRIGRNLLLIDPVSYFDMLILEKNALAILTDSGGVQKEAYILSVPCITLREETEWVETVESGWNRLTGVEKNEVVEEVLNFVIPEKHPNFYGEGETSLSILSILQNLSGLDSLGLG